MSVTLRYFAWVRERIGKTEETVDLPAEIVTVGQLVGWLAQRGEEYAYAFENPGVIRAALARPNPPPGRGWGGAREIGFFPPMTGG